MEKGGQGGWVILDQNVHQLLRSCLNFLSNEINIFSRLLNPS